MTEFVNLTKQIVSRLFANNLMSGKEGLLDLFLSVCVCGVFCDSFYCVDIHVPLLLTNKPQDRFALFLPAESGRAKLTSSCRKMPRQSFNTGQFMTAAASGLLIVCHVPRRLHSRGKVGSGLRLMSTFLAKRVKKTGAQHSATFEAIPPFSVTCGTIVDLRQI